MFRLDKDYITYCLIRIATFGVRFLPSPAIHFFAKIFGYALYYLHPKFRKRALSNLALASDLNLSNKDIIKTAKASFVNLCITFLEYPKLDKVQNIQKLAHCKNPDIAMHLIQKKQGVIFFCAHQANWELLFLEGTSRMPGVAIGRPIKNKKLYDWALKIRSQFGGCIIEPKNAIKESLRALKQGKFLGIVGDQGMPGSFFSSPFLGRHAYTSPIPALLSYKTGSPIFFASIKRVGYLYEIEYSDPIWPDQKAPQEQEIANIMRQLLKLLEKSIQQNPDQWLWQHNRWKQEEANNVYYKFRHDTLLVIMPETKQEFLPLLPLLKRIETIYPKAFIDVLCSPAFQKHYAGRAQLLFYQNKQEIKLSSYQHKLVFDFSGKNLRRHYHRHSAMEVLDFHRLKQYAFRYSGETTFKDEEEMLLKAISRKGVMWGKNHAS